MACVSNLYATFSFCCHNCFRAVSYKCIAMRNAIYGQHDTHEFIDAFFTNLADELQTHPECGGNGLNALLRGSV